MLNLLVVFFSSPDHARESVDADKLDEFVAWLNTRTTTTSGTTVSIENSSPECITQVVTTETALANSVKVAAIVDVKAYTCRLCFKGFGRRWDFYRHLNAVHKGRG